MKPFGAIAVILCSLTGPLAWPALAEGDRVAEDQTPTGKFLTATEVRPILDATQANWVAVREYEGQDLIYFTHLLSWRCGLFEVQYTINEGPRTVFTIPECAPDIANAMAIPDGTVIYIARPLGSVQTIKIDVLYDDLGTASASFDRAAVLIP
ncbi:MAG: hypothetical protein ACU0A6_16540 [Shimia sp.]|uniref:hypothetical protein n=1 Tax=Shimia sp. TaxID=1954381 RepID=UPI00405877C6